MRLPLLQFCFVVPGIVILARPASVDDKRQPGLESLATIAAARIVELTYLDQNRVVLLHGPDKRE